MIVNWFPGVGEKVPPEMGEEAEAEPPFLAADGVYSDKWRAQVLDYVYKVRPLRIGAHSPELDDEKKRRELEEQPKTVLIPFDEPISTYSSREEYPSEQRLGGLIVIGGIAAAVIRSQRIDEPFPAFHLVRPRLGNDFLGEDKDAAPIVIPPKRHLHTFESTGPSSVVLGRLDIEQTGLESSKHRVIEIGDNRYISRKHTSVSMVNPMMGEVLVEDMLTKNGTIVLTHATFDGYSWKSNAVKHLGRYLVEYPDSWIFDEAA